jgi:DNA-binding NtrC family response regulator
MNEPAADSTRGSRVLVVDDGIENLSLLTAILERAGFEVTGAPSAAVALELAARQPIDLAILDIVMPGVDGWRLQELLAAPSSSQPPFPVIFISGRNDPETIVRAFDAGCVDYVTKPIQEREVVARVTHHLRLHRLQRELERQNAELALANRKLAEQLAWREQAEEKLRCADDRLSLFSSQEAERWGLPGFVGAASSWRDICEEIRRLQTFARTNVLVLGESGCGKELVARAIHYGGARESQPFIALNCSAIPSELAESMLFGHLRGAYTGATNDRKGCFELADRGTLFLDEIGDLPLPLQAKLLRTLEDGSFTPIGALQEKRVDVRVISATHRDLEQRVQEGSFRQDLYFRLAQYVVRVPPLRERPDDIPLLTSHFVQLFAAEMNLPCPPLADDAVDALHGYAFPGNVRELKNIAERALIVSGGGPITREHLQLPQPAAARPARARPELLNLDKVKADLVERALALSGGNVSAAARYLGVHRSSLYRRNSRDDASR